MSERIFIGVAWPYANGSIHFGQIAGCYLPADIFARYHRLKDNNVLMVSGSDAHGTPVTITAENKNTTPEKIYAQYQEEFLEGWQNLGIKFDLFTTTHTENHFRVAQEMFSKLYESGFIYKDSMSQPFCESHDRFLADRYVEGICPHCRFDGARGDQCDGCGQTLDPKELINIKHRDCEDSPTFRDTEHFFLKLSAFEKRLREWVEKQDHWKINVRNFTLGFLDGGLKDRAITRDISWGIPVPLQGYESKCLYVWFEAVIGYLSATIEWASSENNNQQWETFWQSDSKSYYFMGKDNIPFHTVIWPAMLLGHTNLNLPYDVPANEYVNMEHRKISTSRNWVVTLKDYLELYEPDSLRYSLAAIMPETSDSDFSWQEYLRRTNDELVATYGNLVHRVLSMLHRYFNGTIPDISPLDDMDNELLSKSNDALRNVGIQLENCRFRNALSEAMNLAQEANKYLNDKAPWKSFDQNPEDTAKTLVVTINVVNCLRVIFSPFLPFSSDKLQTMIGLDDSLETSKWSWSPSSISPGMKIEVAKPLFKKLEEDVVDIELERLEKAR